MNLRELLICLAVVTFGAVESVSIDHDKVQPFAQPEPAIISEKAAVRFKPSLRVESGCHPYPAVNAAGETSGGLKGSGTPTGGCKGSKLGSQVYARSVWYNDLWAIMYAWYFPKDRPPSFLEGQRHEWVHVIVWLDNPAHERPTVIGPRDRPSRTIPVVYYLPDLENRGFHTVSMSWEYGGGEYQDLIMWEQLTDEARIALNDTDFGYSARVPFIDANFKTNLEVAWPY